MSRSHGLPTWSSAVAAVLFAGLVSLPVSSLAQRAVPRSGSDQPATGGRTRGGDSGGGRVASGGGKTDSGGQRSSGGDQSAGEKSSGGQSGGSAVRRAPASDNSTREGSTPTVARRDRGNAGGSGTTTATAGDRSSTAPTYSRPRGNNPATGQAVERKGLPPGTGDGGTTVWVPGGYYGGYYPWGYGAFGLGGYYGGYYDPWYTAALNRTIPVTTTTTTTTVVCA